MSRVFAFLCLLQLSAQATVPDRKNLPIGLAPHEVSLAVEPTRNRGPAPIGPVDSLGEWEEAEAAMTLWTNPTFVKALSERGRVRLFADTNTDKVWWENWLQSKAIDDKHINFFEIMTDSIWIRDYGPWPVVDGNGAYAFVDTIYNRPRPYDDKVPQHLGKLLGVPVYDTGLVHTGGNYYSDGMGNAFSSTLVYTENAKKSKADIDGILFDFLGIERYVTSKLAPGITIEHLDTFGKLVAPDTWVFSDFPAGSRYRADSEAMVALLKTLKSPYGTPYKIFRMPMVGANDNYRAYINSFISNGSLYFPAYGDSSDAVAKSIYEAALPGYEIVGVSAAGTVWGDSVHCRSRNLIQRDALFLFPRITPAARTVVEVDAIAAPGQSLVDGPRVRWTANGVRQPEIVMSLDSGFRYRVELPMLASGAKVSLSIYAKDSGGHEKTAPIRAPKMTIDFAIP